MVVQSNISKRDNRKINKSSDRLSDYTISETADELTEVTEIPRQTDFFKIPKKFAKHTPVDQLPLGCDKEQQYYAIYPRVELPFQPANRVTFGHPNLKPNRLFWGDNLHVMRMLPSNSIDLIYIDPPFFSGANYNVLFGDQNEIRSFSDIWKGGMPTYLIWLNARLLEMKRLLKPSGTIYVHLDYHAMHYVKVEMDKIFGYVNFQNEIAWKRHTSSQKGSQYSSKNFGSNHDSILVYTKNNKELKFNMPKIFPRTEEEIKKKFPKIDASGRRYHDGAPIWSGRTMGSRPNLCYEWKGFVNPYPSGWRLSKKRLDEEHKKGNIEIVTSKDGKKRIRRKVYFEDYKGENLSDLWIDIPIAAGKERIGYPTQKPESLLERIIYAATNEGDVVADFFCGGGTTPAVAQKMNRRWIASDQSRVAVAITQGRLEKIHENASVGTQHSLTPIPDISVEYWGTYEIPALETLGDIVFRQFIISAYGGRVASGDGYVHGFKRSIPIFVGSAKQRKRVTKTDVIDFAKEVTETKGKHTGIMIAWSFAPSARNAVERLQTNNDPSIELIQISLVDINSPIFKDRIIKLHEDYKSLLQFIMPPKVSIKYKNIGSAKYEFNATESLSLNLGSKIVNVQWDFDYAGRFTPTQGFAYGREGKNDEIKPLFIVQYKFERLGKTTIACRVQDDLGGEKIEKMEINVK